ncbi:hypothetical protein niasHT_010749 [Heterodera trifolii]|uniref:Uncharacterized protein n=1 Tax=Heterodera trifolii TaxID=157864 RepID=A0ABD2LGA1_9BILA
MHKLNIDDGPCPLSFPLPPARGRVPPPLTTVPALRGFPLPPARGRVPPPLTTARACARKAGGNIKDPHRTHRFTPDDGAGGHFVEYGTVPSVAECNRKEPILGTFAVLRHFGCPLAQLPANIGPLVAKTINASQQTAVTNAEVLLDQDGFACKLSPATICVVEESKGTTESWLAIAEGASDSEIFDALFKMAFYAEVKRWPNGLEVSKFRHEMATMGWSLQINQLDVDEWRYRSREKWT